MSLTYLGVYKFNIYLNIWIIPVRSENWLTVKSKKIWAVTAKGKCKQILKGDKIIFYVVTTLHFHAIYEVKNDWHESTMTWPNNMRTVLEIDLIEIQQGFANVKDISQSLGFINPEYNIGLCLRGSPQGPANNGNPISDDDYNLILNELKSNQDEPDFNKINDLGNEIIELIDLPLDSDMHEKISTEKKTLEDIFRDVQKGKCAVPDFQRYWIWKTKQIEELWESILCKYYVGSLLTWNSPEQQLGKIPIIGGSETIDKPDLILDGQQRITAIYYAIKAPDISPPGTSTPYRFFVHINALLNTQENSSKIVDSYDIKKVRSYRLDDRETQYKKKLFPLTEIQDLSEWVFNFYEYLKCNEKYDDDNAKKYRKRIEDLLKSAWSTYEIPVVKLPENLPLDNVATVFERINSKGTPLGVFDLLNARFILRGIVLKKQWEAVKKIHYNLGKWYDDFKNYKVPLYIILAMSLSKSGTLGRKELLMLDEKYIMHDKFQPENFLDDFEEMAKYVEEAVVRITCPNVDWFGATKYDLIPHTVMVPVLAALLREAYRNPDISKCMKKIKYWYWTSVFSEKYSSSSNTVAESDFKRMKRWFDDDDSTTLPFEQEQPSSFNVKKNSNSLYKAVICATAHKGALDFKTGQPPQFAKLEIHHIFPSSKTEEFGANDNIDSVLNKVLIDADTNRFFTNKDPSKYLTEIMDDQKITDGVLQERLSTHLISSNAFTCLMNNDFAGFIKEREITICEEFKELTKRPV